MMAEDTNNVLEIDLAALPAGSKFICRSLNLKNNFSQLFLAVEKHPSVLSLPWREYVCGRSRTLVSKQGRPYRYRTLSFPYWIIVVSCFGDEKNGWKRGGFGVFFRKAPISAVDCTLFRAPLYNQGELSQCLGFLPGDNKYVTCSAQSAIDYWYNAYLEKFFTNVFGFDRDVDDNYSRAVSRANGNAILNIDDWEEKTKKDPHFALSASWEPVCDLPLLLCHYCYIRSGGGEWI